MANRGDRRNGISKGVLFLVFVTVFLIGFVVGMVVINFAPKKEIEQVAQDLKMTVQSQRHVTNVYVPKRESFGADCKELIYYGKL